MFIQKRDIVQRFSESGLLVHPDVINYIVENGGSGVIETIINSVPTGTFIVTPKYVPGMVKHSVDKLSVGVSKTPEIIIGQEGYSVPATNIEESSELFRDRYNVLSSIMRSRVSPIPIEALNRQSSRFYNSDVSIVGLVIDYSTSLRGNKIVEVEDPTGSIKVLFNSKINTELFEEAEKIIPDEVIGIKGKLSQERGNAPIIFANALYRPDIPITHTISPSKEPGSVALISDIHIGSKTFLHDAWDRFSSWLEDHIEVKYLLIAGDLVDGIGIYPEQDKELDIKTIYEQYDAIGDLLCSLPSRLQIVVSPGNHDAVRPAEPQPVIPEEFRTKFPKNVSFVENPATINLQSINIMMYHGRSIDDLIKYIPNVSYDKPSDAMKAMLQRRHLAPIYGQRTPLLSATSDHLLIRDVPDILHIGHVHITDILNYRGVLGVNSGAWQVQTSFQKQMNIHPTPAEAIVVDLSSLEHQKLCFMNPK